MKIGVDYIGVGIGAVIIDAEGKKLLLARRGKGARNEVGKWEFPGGGVEFGDTFKNSVIREVKEEFDIEVEILESLGVMDHFIPAVGEQKREHWVSMTYLCQYVSGTPRILEPDKCEEFGWFTLEEVMAMDLSIASRANVEMLKEWEKKG